jgi:hypothetical protein
MQIWFHPLPHLRGGFSNRNKASVEHSLLSRTIVTLRSSSGLLDTLFSLRRFYKSTPQQSDPGRRMKYSVRWRDLRLQLSGG